MRFLVVFAHPIDDSFQSALHRRVVAALEAAGHEVDDCNLYAEGFDPILSAEERRSYHAIGKNTAHVEDHIARLRAAEGLVLVSPTWWFSLPAMLKGYIDRVWVPGVAFELKNGRTTPGLAHIKKYAVVITYGTPWWLNRFVLPDSNRAMLMRCLPSLFSRRTKKLWLAQYGMDTSDARTRERFLDKVERKLRSF